ncbi:hypothetical protein BGZ65_005994 [Modicella reniformis]|uniref:Uncharacterized protein n=1 Tax=Modicella reniformis TaxID=1440133 RepID=A0A9P6IKS6_9FUNG|nr:hypothetical protein BGZ65_005994 [Modicella reniformis]
MVRNPQLPSEVKTQNGDTTSIMTDGEVVDEGIQMGAVLMERNATGSTEYLRSKTMWIPEWTYLGESGLMNTGMTLEE